MKVLIVSAHDKKGGAAKAAYRLHRALLAQNINSKMLVQNKKSTDETVIGAHSKIGKYLNPYRPALDHIIMKFYKTQTLFSSSYLPFSQIVKQINKISPDIVNLHWICGGTLKIEDIAKIKARVVWSLHDMWAFTGGCHYDKECGKYQQKCGSCPILGSNKNNDLSRKIFDRKQKNFAQKNMTIIGLSSWLSECAKNSSLLKDKHHINLPNPIETDVFKPTDKGKARELWHLPKDKKLILFGINHTINNINKGFNKLNEALRQLKNTDIELLVFGSNAPKKSQNFGFKTHYLGYIEDNDRLITLYNAADVVVVPSLQENLSNTIMESMACGKAVVGFDIGGNADMIQHKNTGYLAKPFSISDLASGIEWVLNNKQYDRLCKNARAKILTEFDSKIVAKKYIKLYQNLL